MARWNIGDRVLIGDLDKLGVNSGDSKINQLLSLRECVVVDNTYSSIKPYKLDAPDDKVLAEELTNHIFKEEWLMDIKYINTADDSSVDEFLV